MQTVNPFSSTVTTRSGRKRQTRQITYTEICVCGSQTPADFDASADADIFECQAAECETKYVRRTLFRHCSCLIIYSFIVLASPRPKILFLWAGSANLASRRIEKLKRDTEFSSFVALAMYLGPKWCVNTFIGY